MEWYLYPVLLILLFLVQGSPENNGTTVGVRGGHVTLRCPVDTPGEIFIFSTKRWFKVIAPNNDTGSDKLKLVCLTEKQGHSRVPQNKTCGVDILISSTEGDLTIRHLTLKDAGLYKCQFTGSSDKYIHLIVQDTSSHKFIIPFIVAAVTCLVLTVLAVILWRRTCKPRAQLPMLTNTNKCQQPMEGMEVHQRKHSGSTSHYEYIDESESAPQRIRQGEPQNLQGFTVGPVMPPRYYLRQQCQRMESGCAQSYTSAIWSPCVLADVISLEAIGNAVQTDRRCHKAHTVSFRVPRRDNRQTREPPRHGSCSDLQFDDFENQGTHDPNDNGWYMKLNKDTMERCPF